MSVVIPTAGRDEHLRRCVGALVDAHIELEIVVVDLAVAGSVDEVLGSIALPHHTQLLQLPPWAPGLLRVGEGRNVGAAAATTARLCFLDVDCLVTPDGPSTWNQRLTAGAAEILMPPVRFLRHDWSDIVSDDPVGTDVWMQASVPADRPTPKSDRVAVDEVDLFWSLAFCCTAATFRRTGGFDISYVGYGAEDTDLARRAARNRLGLVWLSGPPVFHQHHPPSRWDPDRLPALVANARRFRSRWGDWPMPDWLAELAARGVVIWDPSEDVLEVAEEPC
jgi:hypothetical protein